MVRYIIVIGLIFLCGIPALSQDKQASVFLHEDFDALTGWKALYFPKINRHSRYTAVHNGTESFLKAESDSSASALLYEESFNVYEFPNVEWKWTVDTIYQNGNVQLKSGDDYPLRIYIMFPYDPEVASFQEKILYGLAKTFYGEYPPHSSLNYIWANREYTMRIMPSPYTDRSQMIILQAGESKLHTWIVENVNILDDYRRAFGSDPPLRAHIAVMND